MASTTFEIGRTPQAICAHPDRPYTSFTEVMADARRIMSEYPDLRASVQGVNAFAGGGNRMTDFEFDLIGPELDQLQAIGDRIMAGMHQVPGFVDIDSTLALRKPEVREEHPVRATEYLGRGQRRAERRFGARLGDIGRTGTSGIGGSDQGD